MNKFIIILLISGSVFGQQIKRKLVWEENFDGKTLNYKEWNIELGDGCPNCGWGNNERQLYTDKNHRIENGNLMITAKKNENGYTSTRITTKKKKEFKYGRLEARAKLPSGHGIWPAFWMLGSNISESGWPKCGEIDILEYIGREPHTAYTTLHTQDNHGDSANSKKTTIPNIEDGYHVYAIEWTKDKIDFFVDKDLVYTFQPEIKN